MKTKIDLIYISLSGNTDSFVKRLRDYLLLNTKIKEVNLLNVKELVKENIPFNEVSNNFVAFLPTYLEGGNGIDNGDKEILTTPLREYILYKDNYKKCLGIVGSGNKNFNNQYCLTAKQYSQEFGFPVLYNFELRGLDVDIQKVSSIIENILSQG
jgi:ribonucleotide reductase (nrdI family protein), putative